MATMPPSSLQLPNPFRLASSSTKPHSRKPFFSLATRATDPERKRKSASNLYLPPVPLKEAVYGGLMMDFGFSPYRETLNGRIAVLGLTALLVVELATGKSVLKYHKPSVVLVQVYFVAAVAAVCIKYEKEKVGG